MQSTDQGKAIQGKKWELSVKDLILPKLKHLLLKLEKYTKALLEDSEIYPNPLTCFKNHHPILNPLPRGRRKKIRRSLVTNVGSLATKFFSGRQKIRLMNCLPINQNYKKKEALISFSAKLFTY